MKASRTESCIRMLSAYFSSHSCAQLVIGSSTMAEEGTNVWIDSWVILTDAPNKENAEKFIDFMCRGDIAVKNFEYIKRPDYFRLITLRGKEPGTFSGCYIDFMCRGDIAVKNFEYITYSTPNDAARELIEDEDIRKNQKEPEKKE